MRARARAGPLACVALCLGVATACSGGSPSDGSDASSSASSAASTSTQEPSASATASPSASPTSPASSPASGPASSPASSPTPTSLRGRLLDAAAMPGFNPDYRWVQGTTAPENPSTSFGTCQRFSVTSIGAERALVRRFRPADARATNDRAGELVAQFPDTATARRAYAVLKAWRATCAGRLPTHTRVHVGALEDVSAPGGSAGWYLLTYGPVKGDRNAQFFDAQGMTVVGTRIAMVALVAAGQDYNYESGHEPMVAALQRAAQRLH